MLQSKVAELKGMKYSVYYLQIHHANKIVLMFLMLLLFSLLSAVTQDVATLVLECGNGGRSVFYGQGA